MKKVKKSKNSIPIIGAILALVTIAVLIVVFCSQRKPQKHNVATTVVRQQSTNIPVNEKPQININTSINHKHVKVGDWQCLVTSEDFIELKYVTCSETECVINSQHYSEVVFSPTFGNFTDADKWFEDQITFPEGYNRHNSVVPNAITSFCARDCESNLADEVSILNCAEYVIKSL